MTINRRKYWLYGLSLLALMLLGVFLWKFLIQQSSFLRLFSSTDEFIKFIESHGEYAKAIYVAMQALQVVLAPIPGEFTGSIAGMIFGGAQGAVLATVGLAIGSLVAFSLGRLIGRPLVSLMVSEKQLKKYAYAVGGRKQLVVVFVVFLIPGFPKDALTYIFSLGKVPYWGFFLVSQLARLPGTVLLTFSGEALLRGNWPLLVAAAILAAFTIAIGFLKRQSIQKWLMSSET